MNEVQIMKQVPTVSSEQLGQRKQEYADCATNAYNDAKLVLDDAKMKMDYAKQTVKRQKLKVEVTGFSMQFLLADIEAMNDLISGDTWGRDGVEAIISPDLMQLAAATIQFTRKQRAQFECLGDGMVGVTAKGRGEV